MRRLLLLLALVPGLAWGQGAVSYVGAGTLANGTGNISTPLPAGWAAGDLCLLQATSIDNQTHSITVASGWSTVVAQVANTANQQWSLWYKVLTGTESNPTVTRGTTTARLIARTLCWRCVDATTPYVAGTSQTNTTTAGGTLGTATPAVTSTINGAVLLHLLGLRNATNATIAVTSPTNVNGTTYSSGFSAGGTSTTRNAVAFYSLFQASSGTSGTSTITTTQADQVVSIHMAIQPSSVSCLGTGGLMGFFP